MTVAGLEGQGRELPGRKNLGRWMLCAASLFVAMLCLFPPKAWALDGNDELKLELIGELQVSGWYVGIDGDQLRLSGDNRFTDVQLDQIVAVQRDGSPVDMTIFLAEVEAAQADLIARRADPASAPPPALVFATSLAWAGTGHAALGDWRGAAAWASVDAALVGVAAWDILAEESVGAAIPALALDVLCRGLAAGDAARIARRRRRALRDLDKGR